MIRQIIIPTTTNFVLQLPNTMLGKAIEVTAIEITEIETTETITPKVADDAYKQAIQFFKQHAVPFNQIKKWNREDLYE